MIPYFRFLVYQERRRRLAAESTDRNRPAPPEEVTPVETAPSSASVHVGRASNADSRRMAQVQPLRAASRAEPPKTS